MACIVVIFRTFKTARVLCCCTADSWAAACWMCIIPGYTLGINSSFVEGWERCTVGFISYLGMAYPDAEVGLLPTLESPWASFSSRWCLSTAEEGGFYIRKHLQRSPRYEGSQVTPCDAQPSLGAQQPLF